MNNHEPNHTAEADRIRAELEDYLMDQNLEEVLGGVTANPEDRAVAPAPVAATESAPAPTAQSSRSRSWLKPVALLATCAGIGLVLFNGLLFDIERDLEQQVAMSESASGEISSRDYSPEDLQLSSNAKLSSQNRALAKYQREQAEAMREIHGMADDGQSAPRPSTAPIHSIDLSEAQTEVEFDQLKMDYSFNSNISGEVSGQSRARAANLSAGRANRPASAPARVPEKWKIKVRSGSQESVRGFVLNDPQPDFDYNIQNGQRDPRDTRKGTLTWENGGWVGDTDGLEGVGPGNRGDNYERIIENEFLSVVEAPLSTFSIDVDTASYSNMRRMLTQNNMLPPPDAVRIEELVNYFNYDYPEPQGEDPFSVSVEMASCPWRPESRLLRIALKGEEIPFEERPASNLVFLLDVSGSMNKPNKLPLLKSCFKMLVDYLTENDTISIVVYASGTRTVLPPTTGDEKSVIMEALDQLQAGGSTNGAGGIQLAYQTATENFIPGGLNRVILATDGDFNVGITSRGDLHRLIEEKAKSNVFLTTLGFGFGNLQDNTIELLADKGNGNYAYIDSLAEGRKVLVDEMGSTLNTIAKDVKIQIEFNPLEVAGYRLIGYENRLLDHQDFNDDTKDAGEIGAGHTVTAFYEIIPAGDDVQLVEKEVDELEFQRPQKPTKFAKDGDMVIVKLRYKKPMEKDSSLLRVVVRDSDKQFSEASRDFQFAASVASFGMLLRNSKYAGQASFKNVLEQAQATLGESPESYRVEFIELVKIADRLIGEKVNW